MKVLIVGGGGREHALAWKAAQSASVETVYVAPGNAGTALEPGIENIDIGAEDIAALAAFARERGIDLTLVGPEAPLVAGIVDAFEDAGLACFGPGSRAAVLEGSKAFTKEFLKRHRIPTASFEVFTDRNAAFDHVRRQSVPIVVKADGLAAGKGVVVARSEQEAFAAVSDMLEGNLFGEAGHRVVIEEYLEGEEASFIVMCDGEHILPLASSQDHKTRDAGDRGPNTGGMGACSPAPAVTGAIHDRILDEIIRPTVDGMRSEDRRYTGFLYAGVMILSDGSVRVLEFNCRFGDPEAQPILMRMQGDLVGLCEAALAGRLDRSPVEWDRRAALGVVMASRGYPAGSSKGDIIDGLEGTDSADVKVFHAGTAVRDDRIVTNGGRVLCVTALGSTVTDAQKRAYDVVKKIRCPGMFCRNDIGFRAVAREAGAPEPGRVPLRRNDS